MIIEEVAECLNCSAQWVYDQLSRSEPSLPAIRLGGIVRFAPSAIDKFIASMANVPVKRGKDVGNR